MWEVAEYERVHEVEETCPKHEKDEHSDHRQMDTMVSGGFKNRYHQNAQLANDGQYDTYDSENGLLFGDVRLKLMLFPQNKLHQQRPDKEDQLEPRACYEQRVEICGPNVTDVHWVLVFSIHECIDRPSLCAPTCQHGDEHSPPYYKCNEWDAIVVDLVWQSWPKYVVWVDVSPVGIKTMSLISKPQASREKILGICTDLGIVRS